MNIVFNQESALIANARHDSQGIAVHTRTSYTLLTVSCRTKRDGSGIIYVENSLWVYSSTLELSYLCDDDA